MTNKKLYLSALLTYLVSAIPVSAQSPLAGEGEYRFSDATQLWRNTDLAAGLSIDSARNRGLARFDAIHRQGDYSRVQEGNMENRLQFFTERYQTIGKYLYGYGRFQFDMSHVKDRSWSDVQRTYHSDPFIVGSSVRGAYDNQRFDFTAALGTTAFRGWRFGARLDYLVSDLSRLRDPRSRSQLLDYRITPSATYTTGRSTFGVSGFYNRRKEKIPNINTVQDDPNLVYYQMSGMEAASGTTGGYKGFQREWVNHQVGASLAYGYKSGDFSSLTTATVSRGEEYIYEQYKREPGRYTAYRYALNTRNRLLAGRLLHQLDLSADYQEGFADEYRQELQIDNDPETGYTSYSYQKLITFKKRYQTRCFDLDLHYRLNTTDDRQATTGYVGLLGHLSTNKDKHLLPTSQLKLAGMDVNIEGGKALLPGHRLWIDASVGYHHAATADLDLSDATTDYAVQVLLPDMDYYRADYWRGTLSVTYQFPLSIRQTRSCWFVRAYGNYLKAGHSLDASTVGLSIGLFN